MQVAGSRARVALARKAKKAKQRRNEKNRLEEEQLKTVKKSVQTLAVTALEIIVLIVFLHLMHKYLMYKRYEGAGKQLKPQLEPSESVKEQALLRGVVVVEGATRKAAAKMAGRTP